jgi:hypothetical protein
MRTVLAPAAVNREKVELRGTPYTMSERIPIHQGLYIWLSKDGRALHRGESDSDVLSFVRSWLSRNREHKHHELVQRWTQQKTKQIAEEAAIAAERSERERINSTVDKALKQNKSPLPDELAELVRDEAFKARGIPRKEG